MRHDHIVVTLDPDSKARIRADLDAGESVEAWVADAVERKLDEDGSREDGSREDGSREDGSHEDGDDGADEDGIEEAEVETDAEDERNGYEFVDDCAI